MTPLEQKENKRTIKFTVSFKVKEQDIRDLLDSASRGSDYWCGGSEKLGFVSYVDRVMNSEAGITLSDIENDGKKHRLSRKSVLKGLKLMAGDPEHTYYWEQFINGRGNQKTGDTFLQLCLLGKRIYS